MVGQGLGVRRSYLFAWSFGSKKPLTGPRDETFSSNASRSSALAWSLLTLTAFQASRHGFRLAYREPMGKRVREPRVEQCLSFCLQPCEKMLRVSAAFP